MKLTGTNRPITYTTHPSRERIQKTFTPGKGTKKQDCLRPLCGSQPTNPLLEARCTGTKPQQNNNTTDVVTTDFPTPAHQRVRGGARVTAVIAWGKRPVPSRTRKLRPTAPMVLHPGGCGRVGHRRNTINGRGPPPPGGGPPAFNRPLQDRAGPGGPRPGAELGPDKTRASVPSRTRVTACQNTGPRARHERPTSPGQPAGHPRRVPASPPPRPPSRPARTMGPVPSGQRPGWLPGGGKSAGGDGGGTG